MQMIKKNRKKISKTNEKKSTISKTISVENFLTNYKKTWTKFSSKKRKRIRLESQLKKNVIETDSQFAVMTRKIQKIKHEKNKTKSKTRKYNKFRTNFQNFDKKKIVDSNMNFVNENIFQKKLQIMNEKSFFSSFQSLLSVSVNFYEEISSNVNALNSLNSIELIFQSILNRRDVLIFRFRIFNSRINSIQSISNRRDVLISRFRIFNSRINLTQNIQSPSFNIIRNQNIQSLSFESSFAINRHRAKLEYITSKNIFIRSQNFSSRSSFFFNCFFRVFHFSIEIRWPLHSTLKSKHCF